VSHSISASHMRYIYFIVLQCADLGREIYNAVVTTECTGIHPGAHTPELLGSPKRPGPTLLQFTTPSKRQKNYESGPYERLSSSPLSKGSQELLATPRKQPRYIARAPYKVLDAPDLQVLMCLDLLTSSVEKPSFH
jgi:hypothetical protein